MTKQSKFCLALKRISLGLVLCFLVCVLGSVLFLVTIGFPEWLKDGIIARMPSGTVVIDAKSMKLDLIHGLVVRDVRFYKKGVVGPAFLDAEEAVLRINPLIFLRKTVPIKKIKISRGVCRNNFGDKALAVVSGEGVRTEKIEVIVHDFIAHGIEVRRMSCNLYVDETMLYLDNINCELVRDRYEGNVMGTLQYSPATGTMDSRLTAVLDPHLLLPLLDFSPFLTKLVNWFEFKRVMPRWEGRFAKTFGPDRTFKVEGDVWLRDCMYRDVDIRRADGRVLFNSCETNRIVVVQDLLVAREEGLGRANMYFDLVEHELKFKGTSTINPLAMLEMLGIMKAVSGINWRFDGPVNVLAEGRADYRDLRMAQFKARVSGKGMGIGKLVSDDCSFNMEMSCLTNTISNVSGKIYEGTFDGCGAFVLPDGARTNIAYEVRGSARDVDFAKIACEMTRETEHDYEGRLSTDFNFKGMLGNPFSTDGSGTISIKDGRVFMLPLFGGLSKFLGKIIPGLNFVLRQTDAHVDVVIADGKIHSDKVQIDGDVLSLSGKGDYYFSRSLDFDVQIKLLKSHTVGGKVVRAITYPLSKLFEFRLRGTLNEPDWYPVNFSTDLFEKVGLKEPEEIK